MRRAWLIASKELREGLRDRRSLVSGLFYGVWGPLVMGAALIATAGQQADIGEITIGVDGADRAPSLVAFLENKDIRVTALNNTADAIRERRAAVALLVSGGYATDFSESRPAEVVVQFDSTWPESMRLAAHVRSALVEYSRTVGETRLLLRGVAPSAIAAVRVIDRDFSTASARASRTLSMLPIFVLLAAFIGGMSVAADVTAGERERGSLESLLLHPVSRFAVAGGKWAAVWCMAILTVVLALAVSFAVLQHPRLQALDIPIGLTTMDAAVLLAVLAPLAAAAAGVQLWTALQSHTFKEAQASLSTLIFLPMVPGFLFAFGTLQPARWMEFTPVMGQHLLIAAIVRGGPLPMDTVLILSTVTLALGAAGWAAAGAALARETVLKRAGA